MSNQAVFKNKSHFSDWQEKQASSKVFEWMGKRKEDESEFIHYKKQFKDMSQFEREFAFKLWLDSLVEDALNGIQENRVKKSIGPVIVVVVLLLVAIAMGVNLMLTTIKFGLLDSYAIFFFSMVFLSLGGSIVRILTIKV